MQTVLFGRTVCKTVLLFVLLRTYQFPRLGAEVPDGLVVHVAWANTPPTFDLPVCLFVPAAGFCLVMRPFLLGQAFFRSELGVSQGQDNPLTGVCLNARCNPISTRRALAHAEQGGNSDQPHLAGF